MKRTRIIEISPPSGWLQLELGAVWQHAVIIYILAVGDDRFKRRCVEKMRKAAKSGRTVLLVSHDLDVLQRISDRAILIRNGRVEMDDAPDRVVAEHVAITRDSKAVPAS